MALRSEFIEKKVLPLGKRLRLATFFLSALILLLGTGLKVFLWSADHMEKERPISFSQEWEPYTLPFAMPPIRLFTFPEHTCLITDYGAIGDGKTMNTRAIALAIDDCAERGGGTVAVPAGHFLTGPIHLKSDIRLDVTEGAELLFSQNPNDYLPVVFSRYEGMELYNYSPLIYAKNCHDIAITGKGVLNGQGQSWWPWKSWQQTTVKKLYALSDAGVAPERRVFGTIDDGLRPSMIQFINCTRAEIQGLTLKNGPMWTLHPLYSDNILIRDVTIVTEGPNNDGIVIDSSKNVLIENVTLDTEDDAIVIKSGLDKDGLRVGKSSENIIIRDCAIGRGNGGIVIGSEMSGDVRNVFVSHCRFDGTKRGFRVKSAPGRGGIVENIWVEDLLMKHVLAEAIFLNMFYDSKNVVRPTTTDPPIFRNFFFKNIDCVFANDAIVLVGAENSLIQNLSFEDVSMRSRNAMTLQHVDGLRLEHFSLRAENRPLISAHDIRNAFFGNPEPFPTPRPLITVSGAQSEAIRFGKSYHAATIRLGNDIRKAAVTYEE